MFACRADDVDLGQNDPSVGTAKALVSSEFIIVDLVNHVVAVIFTVALLSDIIR